MKIDWHTNVAGIVVGMAMAALGFAQNVSTSPSAEEPPPLSWRANATLRDVFFLNQELGWAVGDQGTILRTADGGLSWTLVPVNVSCSLASVHFVDEMNGWAAGGSSVPLVDRTHAVILRTRDGGRTWTSISGTLLPALRELRMNNTQSGWAWGTPTRHFPSGLFQTEDGGMSWSDFSQSEPVRWQAVAPLTDGFAVATTEGLLGTFRRGQFRAARQVAAHPSIRRLIFFDEQRGWALGDGELFDSADGGLSWQPFFLPAELGRTSRFNFAAATQRGSTQWLAGSPGNFIFRRDLQTDQWHRARTPIRSGIQQLFFVDRDNGWAVGEEGHILATRDAGVTWQVQRAGSARTGLLVICPNADSIPFEILARYCADRGFLAAVAFGQADSIYGDGRRRATEACQRQGVSTVIWNSPRRNAAEVERLADLIRQLQPSAIVVADLGDASPIATPVEPIRPSGAPGSMVGAVIDAVALAARPTPIGGSLDGTELPPWQTPLVFQARPVPNKSEFGTPEFLPSLGRNLFDQQLSSESLLRYPTMPGTSLELFAVGAQTTVAQSALFDGVADGPLAPPRRPEQPPRGHVGQIKSIVGKHATLQQLATQFDTSPASLKVWRQRIDRLIEELSPETAGSWLWQLSDAYWRGNQLELAALSRIALLERCGEHPLACEARLWLASYFASQELSWSEFKQQQRWNESPTTIDDRSVRQAGLRSSPEKIEVDGVTQYVWTVDAPEKGTSTDPRAEIQGQLPPTSPTDFSSFSGQRLATAQSLLRSIRQRDAELSADPLLGFAEAQLQRRTEGPLVADAAFRRIPTISLPMAQRDCIGREIRLAITSPSGPTPDAIDCPAASEPPYLDGLLDDDVWRALARSDQMIRLSPDSPRQANENGPDTAPPPRAAADPSLGQTQVMLAHDDEYLYIAAICHRTAPRPARGQPVLSPRRNRDQIGDEPDQLHFAFDLDRDCRTSYCFAVDALGSFAERIGDDRLWNPTWYIAHSQAELNWIVEAAIPLDQLGPLPNDALDSAWGISIRRHLADGATEHWSPENRRLVDPRLGTWLTKPGFAPADGLIRFR